MENPLPQTLPQTYHELLRLTEEQYKLYIEVKRKVVLRNFWDFNTDVIEWKDASEKLHKPLCDFIQDNKTKKRLILLPRGHLKSSIVTVGYCLWKIAQNPKVRILIANATGPMALTFLSQIKDQLTKNERFIELFGDLSVGATKWADDAISVKREESYEAKEPTVTAFGIGGNLVSQHYDVIILDDLVNRENIHTADRISDVIQFYKDVMDLRDNVDTSEVIVLGTRWHEADLYGWLLDEQNPAHYEFKLHERTAVEGDYQIVRDSGTGKFKIDGGEILFPEKFSRDGLEKLINDKGLSDFSAQYLNDPVPRDNAIFKYDWKYYEDDDLRGLELETFITLDPAFFDPTSKRSQDLDFTCFMVISVNNNNDWYIRDIVREHMQPKQILDTMFDLDAKWKPRTIGLESVAYQKILGYMARDMMRERNQFLPITELKHVGQNAKSKDERIQALEPRYAVGSIFHSQNVKHITTLEMELRRFPRSKHDDCADALADMLEIAKPPRKRETRERGTIPFYPA
jgi:predicted phage terminase large subunit-like protein